MKLSIELDREVDGRWIADVPEMPGVIVYGADRGEAITRVKTLALRVIAEQIEHGERGVLDSVNFGRPVKRTAASTRSDPEYGALSRNGQLGGRLIKENPERPA